MERNGSFRTAGFGGFHRQDVLDYIKATAEEHRQQVEELKQSLQKAEATLAAKEEALSELQTRLEEAESARAELEQQLGDSRNQAEGYERLKSDYAEIELSARQRAAVILDQASDRAGQLEADAENQAEDILSKARQQAEQTRMEAEDDAQQTKEERHRLLERTRRDFGTGTDDLNASVNVALREVEQVRKLLLDLRTTFEENAHAVDELCTEEV